MAQLSSLDLNLLLVFRAIFETGHLSRAAERVHLSQPAMSHALARLRKALGDRLFVKGPRGMQPTTRALALAKGVCASLDMIDATLSQGKTFDFKTATARVRIATTDYTEEIIWPALYREIRDKAPEMTIESIGLSSRIPLGELEEGRIDMAVGNFPRPPLSLRTLLLFNDEFICLTRKDHPILRRKPTREQYATASHLLVAPWGVARGNVDEALAELGLERRIAMTVGHFGAVPGILETTDLITTLPKRLATHWLGRYEIKTFDPPVDLPPVKISIIWHLRTHDDPARMFVRESLTRVARRA